MTFPSSNANFYEAAKNTLASRDFNFADSEFENTASAGRNAMRARARWLYANDPIMYNIDETKKDEIIGDELQLQANTGNAKLDQAIEYRWQLNSEYAFEVTDTMYMGDFQRLLLGTRMTDGEAIVNHFYTRDSEFPLKIQMIDVDSLATSTNTLTSYYGEGFLAKTFYDGVEVNKYGKPIGYYFQKTNGQIVRLGANQITHYFNKHRSTQIRGITEYARCIIDQKNLYAMVQAAIQTKRARMNVAYAVESAPNAHTPTGFGSGHLTQNNAQNAEDSRVEQINGVAVHYLRNGEKFVTIDPKVIGDDGNDLITAITRRTAAGRNVSYEFAFRDYTHVNKSSSRASNAGDYRMIEREQKEFIRNVMNPYYAKFIESQVLAGKLPISPSEFYANKTQILSHSFIPPEKRSSDPLEDQKVKMMKFYMGEITLKDMLASRGLDYETQIAQRNKEMEMLGINPRDILISPALAPQLVEQDQKENQ